MITLTVIAMFASLATVLALFDAVIYQEPLLQAYLDLASIHTSYGWYFPLLEVAIAIAASIYTDVKKYRSGKRNESTQ